MLICTTNVENSMAFPFKKTSKHRATMWPWNPTPGQTPWESKNLRRHLHSSLHCHAVYNHQDMETPWKPIDRWANKDVVHTHKGQGNFNVLLTTVTQTTRRLREGIVYCRKWMNEYRKFLFKSIICCRVLALFYTPFSRRIDTQTIRGSSVSVWTILDNMAQIN